MHLTAGGGQHIIGVVAQAIEQVGDAVVLGIQVPHHLVELAHGHAAVFGYFGPLGGLAQALLQQVGLQGNARQQRPYVVV